MQILGNLAAEAGGGLWAHGSTLSPQFTPPPPLATSTIFNPPPTTLSSADRHSRLRAAFEEHPLRDESSTVSPTLVRLCSLWPYIHNSPAPNPPDICQELPKSYILNHKDLFRDSIQYHPGFIPPRRNIVTPGNKMIGIDSVHELTFTGRSFSLMGVLGGVLFILLVIAFITCIRHRKRVRTEADGELDLDIISSRIRRIHQVRTGHQLLSVLGSLPDSPPAPPPSYDTVQKLKEKEESDLPSYLEAIGTEDTCEVTCYADYPSPSAADATTATVSIQVNTTDNRTQDDNKDQESGDVSNLPDRNSVQHI